MEVEARTRRSLEWERLKGYLAAESCSAWSQELCLTGKAHTSLSVVEALLAETAEALAMLNAGFGLSQEGLPELRDVISRLRTGAQMAGKELLSIRRMLLLARRTRSQLTQLAREDFAHLVQFVAQIDAQETLVKAIDEVFDEAGEIRDDASSLLRSLKREVHKLNNQTREELLSIINSATASKALQEPLYTQRNGRYVLPVQASMRSVIPGIVHDSSASGLTVYVEPLHVVELTNKIKLKEAEVEREIDRLLSELSAKAQERHEQLAETNRALVEIDFIAARARLARKYDGVKPQLSLEGQLSLKRAYHPLLLLQNKDAPSPAVPNDIILGGQTQTMIITGPNTGGKTVYLKTAGLLSLMLQAGMLIPVAAGSSALVFKNIFADIGDEQSIEQNLSTFSSHMTNIVEIIARSGEGTLVLLDEIGAGTDPREGAILAKVILEHLNKSGALTISTSHFGEMKSLAYTTSGFINGSFEFDDSNLSPTFHLRIGVPGSSKAITIAARLGLPTDLVASAQAFADSQHTDIQEMIETLEVRLGALDRAEQEMEQQKLQLAHQQAELVKQSEQVDAQREKLRAGMADKMQSDLDEARKLVRSLIADLQKQPSMARAQQLQKDLETLRADLGWLTPPSSAKNQAAFSVGQQVKVLSLNQKGTIETLPDENKAGSDALATVKAGAIRLKVPLSDLVVIQVTVHKKQPPGAQPNTKLRLNNSATHKQARVSQNESNLDVFVRTAGNTLDLRGQRVEEALGNLEKFIDSAYLERLSPVMVIHGHGTGQLKAAVRNYLSEASYQAKWRQGENYEGGDGVTVVQF